MALTQPPLAIRIGLKGTFKGQQVKVVSHVVLSNVEEGETYYWDEWELKASDERVWSLEYDDDAWKIMEVFDPPRPLSAAEAAALTDGASVPIASPAPRVTLRSKATVRRVEGSPTYEVSKGDSAPYLDAEGGGKLYCVEWSGDEAECYRGESVSEDSVLAIFPELRDIAVIERAARKARVGPRKQLAVICLLCSVVAMGLGIKAVMSGLTVAGGGRAIGQLPPDGERFGPYRLEPGVYRLTTNAGLANASSWAAAVMEREDELEVAASAGDMWDESGTDSDGAWHESDMTAKSYFVVAASADYFVRLYAEPESQAATTGTVGFQLEKGVIYPVYFFLYSVLTFVIGFLFLGTVVDS